MCFSFVWKAGSLERVIVLLLSHSKGKEVS